MTASTGTRYFGAVAALNMYVVHDLNSSNATLGIMANYSTAQFKLDTRMRVAHEISLDTRE